MARTQTLRELHDRLAPFTLAHDRLLAVPAPLLPLFPFGGLPPGQSIGFDGPGSWSVALAMAAAITGHEGWMAVIGIEELGLVAAADLGVGLDRLLLIETVPSAQLGEVVAALVGAVKVIAIAPAREIHHRDARRLAARARERETTLLHLNGGRHWPHALDVMIQAEPERWEGIGQGHGHLQHRRLSVGVTGRRSSARQRQVSVVLPDPDGGLGLPSPEGAAVGGPVRPLLVG